MPNNPEILYRSAAQTDAQPQTPALQKFPLPPESSIQLQAEAFDVDFACILDGVFPPAPKNTPANSAIFNSAANTNQRNPNAILTAYSQPSDLGAGIGKWKATFHVVPASWDDVKTIAWSPPGFLGFLGGGTARDIMSYNVNARVHYDYFVIDPAGIASGVLDSGGNAINVVTAMSAIPIVAKKYFCATLGVGSPQYAIHVTSLVAAAGLQTTAGLYLPTLPTVEQYQAWMSVAAAFQTNGSWSQLSPPIWDGVSELNTFGQLVLDDSSLVPYAGNIIARETRYVLCI